MKIDLIIDGKVYYAEPYLGQTECFECALADMCDNIHSNPCQMYHSKVVFKEKEHIDYSTTFPDIPSKGDTIRITRKFSSNVQLEVGDTAKVFSVSADKDTIRLRVKKDNSYISKSINSRSFHWEIVKS